MHSYVHDKFSYSRQWDDWKRHGLGFAAGKAYGKRKF